jgi:hypothetical protein
MPTLGVEIAIIHAGQILLTQRGDETLEVGGK